LLASHTSIDTSAQTPTCDRPRILENEDIEQRGSSLEHMPGREQDKKRERGNDRDNGKADLIKEIDREE
jgi:hypothetical protein